MVYVGLVKLSQKLSQETGQDVQLETSEGEAESSGRLSVIVKKEPQIRGFLFCYWMRPVQARIQYLPILSYCFIRFTFR